MDTEQLKEIKTDTDEVRLRNLIIHNDDFNTFQHVIESLMEVCKHSNTQAEQCAHIIHNNGKCIVKTGSYLTLRPMKEALIDRRLSVVIN